jgi:hypothetical protein
VLLTSESCCIAICRALLTPTMCTRAEGECSSCMARSISVAAFYPLHSATCAPTRPEVPSKGIHGVPDERTPGCSLAGGTTPSASYQHACTTEVVHACALILCTDASRNWRVAMSLTGTSKPFWVLHREQ